MRPSVRHPSELIDHSNPPHQFDDADACQGAQGRPNGLRLFQNPWAMRRPIKDPCGTSEFRLREASVTLGAANLFVPADRFLYVAPSLILHYVDSHAYAPPKEFQDAVLECPEMRSMAYLKAVLANGPRGLVTRR